MGLLARSTVKEQVAASVISTWAGSSGDSNPRSVSAQFAVANKFGLKAATFGGVEKESFEKGKALYARHKEVLDDVVNAMYDSTQEKLKELGIKEVALYRGMTLTKATIAKASTYGTGEVAKQVFEVELNDRRFAVDDMDFTTNPASSYTLSPRIASEFSATIGDDSMRGVAIAEIVPAEHILGMPGAGYGCLQESELVVVGHSGRERKTVVWEKRPQDDGIAEDGSFKNVDDDNWILYAIEKSIPSDAKKSAKTSPSEVVPNIDDVNYDWPKRTDDRLPSQVTKSFRSPIKKAGFNPDQPRDYAGRWISDDEIDSAVVARRDRTG